VALPKIQKLEKIKPFCHDSTFEVKENFSQTKLHPMKPKSNSASVPARCNLGEGGFFNLRVVIGLFVLLAGVFLALAGFGVFSAASTAQAQQNYSLGQSIDPLVPAGFDCSKIHELGIDKQENMRAGAIMIACGEA
jgi:hypothetical protein